MSLKAFVVAVAYRIFISVFCSDDEFRDLQVFACSAPGPTTPNSRHPACHKAARFHGLSLHWAGVRSLFRAILPGRPISSHKLSLRPRLLGLASGPYRALTPSYGTSIPLPVRKQRTTNPLPPLLTGPPIADYTQSLRRLFSRVRHAARPLPSMALLAQGPYGNENGDDDLQDGGRIAVVGGVL